MSFGRFTDWRLSYILPELSNSGSLPSKAGGLPVIITFLITSFSVYAHTSVKQHKRAHKVEKGLREELQQHIDEIKFLRGIVSVCAFCKKIRDQNGDWQPSDVYLRDNLNGLVSHGYCPDCVDQHFD